MPTNPALEASLSLVRDRQVGGNAHPSMLQARYVSASQLVKRTAKDLIKDILANTPRDADEDHWGEDGNAKAAVNLSLVRCQEPSLAVPIPGTGDTINLTGHPDGLDLCTVTGFPHTWNGDNVNSFYATVFENKAPLFEPGNAQVELYYRQGLLYLAMLFDMHARGVRTLQPAAWLADSDPRKRPWALPSKIEVGQVVVCIQPGVAAKREQAFPVDLDTCRKHLDRYLAKAAVVWEGVMNNDPGVGERKWDLEKGMGLGEFDLKGEVEVITDEEFVVLTEKRQAAAARVKEAQEEVDACTEALTVYLKKNEIEEAKVGDFRVVLQRTKGGIRHFTVEDSISLRVYGPRAKKTEQPVVA